MSIADLGASALIGLVVGLLALGYALAAEWLCDTVIEATPPHRRTRARRAAALIIGALWPVSLMVAAAIALIAKR